MARINKVIEAGYKAEWDAFCLSEGRQSLGSTVHRVFRSRRTASKLRLAISWRAMAVVCATPETRKPVCRTISSISNAIRSSSSIIRIRDGGPASEPRGISSSPNAAVLKIDCGRCNKTGTVAICRSNLRENATRCVRFQAVRRSRAKTGRSARRRSTASDGFRRVLPLRRLTVYLQHLALGGSYNVCGA